MELAEQDSKAFDDLLAFLQSHPKIEKYEPANEPMISLPNLEIHLSKRKVFRGQQEIPFTKTEYPHHPRWVLPHPHRFRCFLQVPSCSRLFLHQH